MDTGGLYMYETFLKLSLIVLMTLFMGIITITALFSLYGGYHEDVIILHKSVGILFLIITPAHIFLRKEKLKKMLNELLEQLTSQKSEQCKSHKLLSGLKKRSFEEICYALNTDINNACAILKEKNIFVNDTEKNLETIATENAHDALKIIAMILKNHIRTLQKV